MLNIITFIRYASGQNFEKPNTEIWKRGLVSPIPDITMSYGKYEFNIKKPFNHTEGE